MGAPFLGIRRLCAQKKVVDHRCTYEGRLPETDRVGVIVRWPACKNVTDIRMFLGMIGVCQVFIQDFARLAGPLNELLRKNKVFKWGESQENSMKELKAALLRAVPLGNIDYEDEGVVVLVVDTSYLAIGFHIYQEDPGDKKKKKFIKFGSITLNDREARFSQPIAKRELFGLKRALEASEYLLIGCRKLIVETDAKYIHGMLNHLEMGLNATINRWIEKILMFHFKLRHVAGRCFGPNGLSRCEKQEGDEEYLPDDNYLEIKGPLEFIMMEGAEPPLPFEEFKEAVDRRGGFYFWLVKSEEDFKEEVEQVEECTKFEYKTLKYQLKDMMSENRAVAQFTLENLLPDLTNESVDLVYDESHRTKEGILQDGHLTHVKIWLLNPTARPADLGDRDLRNLIRTAGHFFVSKERRLYRKGIDSTHKLVVEKDKRMEMMKGAHDKSGHRGFYATKNLIAERF